MSRHIPILPAVAIAAAVLLLPIAALAFNPHPDSPRKLLQATTSLGGSDATSTKRYVFAPNGILVLEKRAPR